MLIRFFDKISHCILHMECATIYTGIYPDNTLDHSFVFVKRSMIFNQYYLNKKNSKGVFSDV